jgi:hypothetical protein
MADGGAGATDDMPVIGFLTIVSQGGPHARSSLFSSRPR